MTISINSIMKNPSLCDGIGYRTVLFLQGCDLQCMGCQNQSAWDMSQGIQMEVSDLEKEIRKQCQNKELTISGGEPLMQKEAVLELINLLSDFDICLYTGHDISEIPSEIFERVHYIKYGPFIQELETTVKPFVGSTNQVFMEINHETAK